MKLLPDWCFVDWFLLALILIDLGIGIKLVLD